jgi:hypothetical protein
MDFALVLALLAFVVSLFSVALVMEGIRRRGWVPTPEPRPRVVALHDHYPAERSREWTNGCEVVVSRCSLGDCRYTERRIVPIVEYPEKDILDVD